MLGVAIKVKVRRVLGVDVKVKVMKKVGSRCEGQGYEECWEFM